MTALTIKGHVFEVADDSRVTAGTLLTEGHVAALQQMRRDNIRNNMSRKVEEATKDGAELTNEKHAELQSAVNEYANTYEFGVSRTGGGGGPRVTDPVEREAREEIGKIIKDAYYAKHNIRLTADLLREAVEQVLASDKGEGFRQRARRRVAERERAGDDLLSIGIPAPQQAEAAE